jgi:hypothetical protein
MANLTYRNSATPSIPGSTTVKGLPLSNDEIDANFKAINDEVATKANISALAGYTPLAGTGATGIWGISISGNAATASSVTGSQATLLTRLEANLDNKRVVTASTTTTTIDFNNPVDKATFIKLTMASNTTLTFTNIPTGGSGEVFSWTMEVVNDTTAGRALAFGNTIKWAGGILPPRTTAANAVDIWSFFYENSVLYGSLAIADAK